MGAAVFAAEQIIKGMGMGVERKEWVKKFLNEWGFGADLDWLDGMIVFGSSRAKK